MIFIFQNCIQDFNVKFMHCHDPILAYFQALEAFEKISDGSLSDVNIPNFNLDIKLEDEKINLPPVIENSHSNEENDEIKNDNDITDKEEEPLKKRTKRKRISKSTKLDYNEDLEDFPCDISDYVIDNSATNLGLILCMFRHIFRKSWLF